MNKYLIGLLLGIGLATATSVSALATFQVFQGGTSRTTFPSGNLIYGSLTAPLQTVATTSVTCAGTVSCTTFTAIGPSPITLTGSGGGGSTYPFTPTTFAGTQVSATSTGIWDKAFLGFIASSTLEDYASTTVGLTSGGKTWLSGITSSLVAADANHLLYGAATTTLSGSGVISVTAGAQVPGSSPVTVSCSTCGTGSVTSIASGTGLAGGTITTSGTLWLPTLVGTSSSETAANVPFYTTTNGSTALLSGGDTTFTFTSASKKLIMLNATSTNLSATGSFFVPTTATAPTNIIDGSLYYNTTAASSSLEFGSNKASYATTSVSFSWATSTPSTVATDTIMIINGNRPIKLDNEACGVVGGTATIGIGNGIATSTYFLAKALSSVPLPITLSSNNAFTQFAPIFIAVGTYSANTITTVSCGYGEEYTG